MTPARDGPVERGDGPVNRLAKGLPQREVDVEVAGGVEHDEDVAELDERREGVEARLVHQPLTQVERGGRRIEAEELANHHQRHYARVARLPLARAPLQQLHVASA